MTFSIPETPLPESFQLTHLIFLDPGWQVNLKDEEHVAIGTGDTPIEAIASAAQKVANGEFAGWLYYIRPSSIDIKHFNIIKSSQSASSLLASIGLGSAPIKRRKL